ncbi:MAG: hypothetical protein LJE96_01770 [Deltaproteobacteria bacterium]|nr:hypothetical protein [Deltaproteobacteria bacterium]
MGPENKLILAPGVLSGTNLVTWGVPSVLCIAPMNLWTKRESMLHFPLSTRPFGPWGA